MKILFISDNFPPEVNAPASRTFEHCRAWVRAGHDVTVITCAPNFPRGKVFDGYRNRLSQKEDVDGIRVIRVWSYIAANQGRVRRIVDYLSFMVTATIAGVCAPRPDIVIGTSPQFFTVCAAHVVGKLRRRPWVFELRDFWPESIKAVGAMRESWGLRRIESLEMHLYRRCRGVVAVTHAFRKILIERGIDADKIGVVTNGVDLSRFTPRDRDAHLVRELGLQGKFIAGYIGTHGLAHGLDTILDAAARLQEGPEAERFQFLLLGDGARKSDLKLTAAARGLKNVLFIGSVPKDQVTRYWSLLDVSINHLRATELFTSVIPSKLFEAMGMGVPVLHGVPGESAEIVERYGVGKTFRSEDAAGLAEAIRLLAGDQQALNQMRAAGARAALEFDRAALAEKMLNLLTSWCIP